MKRSSRVYIELTSDQDKQLQELELSPLINAKVRLRASILRLSNQGFNVTKLSQHFNRNIQSIHNDFKRWQEQGIQGLTNGKTTGRPTKFTLEIEELIKQKLSEERIWNAHCFSSSFYSGNVARNRTFYVLASEVKIAFYTFPGRE